MKVIKSGSKWFLFLLLFTTGCSGFNGIRQPMYDGKKIEAKENASNVYHKSREILGVEKEYYFRYPFSKDIYNKSIDYPDEEEVLLEEGSYTIGEDISEGRVTFQGNQSVFAPDNYEVHVGNLIIKDLDGEIYFENLFHSEYGQLVAQVDLIPGHEITIVGTDPEITAFYESELPEDPYHLMTSIQVLENLDRLEVDQPIKKEKDKVSLTAGIYEVGEHLESGTYELLDVGAVHNTEIYLFRKDEEPRVFELLVNAQEVDLQEGEFIDETNKEKEDTIQFTLQEGDKIYPNLVHTLTLRKLQEN